MTDTPSVLSLLKDRLFLMHFLRECKLIYSQKMKISAKKKEIPKRIKMIGSKLNEIFINFVSLQFRCLKRSELIHSLLGTTNLRKIVQRMQ